MAQLLNSEQLAFYNYTKRLRTLQKENYRLRSENDKLKEELSYYKELEEFEEKIREGVLD